MKLEKKNKYDIIIETQNEELLECYRKIDEKDRKIFELFEKRDELQQQNKELLEELKELREKKVNKCVRKEN